MDINEHPTAVEERGKLKSAFNNSKTRASKFKAEEEYSHKYRKVKRNARNDKRNFLEALATEAEVAASKGNFKDMYNITRQLSRKRRPAKRLTLDKEGNTAAKEEDQLKT